MFGMSTVLAIALKTSLLILAVGMASVFLAKKSAAYRYVLWTSVLTLSLLMPFAILYMPSFRVIPVSWQVSEPPTPGPSSTIERLPNVIAEAKDGGSVLTVCPRRYGR